ncbi:myxosortase-dependent M36 family metallopeptidase [Corallococcus llansteffanensis]|uniref:Histidine kinase n=1 Tax=Corallococcus llansteffanensis TaxID=2316731 RepID=A0A3A8Q0T7_9BACT|nr:myxosortase-dependent M36 family metallopeptidase [Corallococcus llansteffanensis]RKH62369.1 histidine kinase [Corallococcus llansteffanensis]
MRLREKLLTSLLLVPMAGTSAWAKERSNYDAFLEQRESRALAVDSATAVARGLRVEQTEQRLGVPTFAWAAQEGAQSKSVIRGGMTTEAAARAHLQNVAESYRLSRTDVSGATLRSVHDTGKGAVIATFEQTVNGIPVFRNEIKVIMGQDQRLVALSGYLAPSDLTQTARAKARTGAFRLGAAEAISGAFTDLTGSGTQATAFVNTGTKGDYTFFALSPSAKSALPQDLATPARARQVFFMMAGGLEPAWYVEVNAGPKASVSNDYFGYVISATTGAVLFRNNLTVDATGTPFTYKVWAENVSPYLPDDGPQGTDMTPHPTGNLDGSQGPLNRPAQNITLANSPYSQNDPWLPANATQTQGNNVDAYADLAAPDGYQPGGGDIRPTTTAANTFGYTFDTTQAPNATPEQTKASVVNLFYVNNFLHDWFYDAGFDEASGNAQSVNYGRGGVEGDPIQAQGQDYLSRNNANMSTPADGASPRMQMYLFNGTPELSVTAPASITGIYEASSASYGSQAYLVTGDIKDAPADNKIGCTAFAADYFKGKVALIDRGTCNFVVKSRFAQEAGAIATVIGNNAPGSPGAMGGNAIDDPFVTTPSLMITQGAAAAWRAELANGAVSVKLSRTPKEDRDGTLDNAVIAHEWGHYISNRLIGNAAGLSNNQGRSMGEGWGDFTAMLMQVRAEDVTKPGNNQWQGVYGAAGYVSSGGRNQGYYYGLRRLPYSTQLAKNGLSFRHISNGIALPANANTTALTGTSNSEVHNSGEVWASMLWDCYTSLLNAHPFQEAQERMKRYIVAGYKATPNAPTFLEARDAILAVALANDPADYSRFVAAFAKRGAGFGAKAPDRNSWDHFGVVESGVTGNTIEVTDLRLDDSKTGCDKDGVLDVGEEGVLHLTVRNVGGGALGAFTGTVSTTSTTATLGFPSGTTVSIPALARGAEAHLTLPVSLTAVTAPDTHAGLKITFNEPSLPAAAQTVTFDPRINYDDVANSSATDFFASGLSAWTVSSNLYAEGDWSIRQEDTDFLAHSDDANIAVDGTLTSPWLTLNATGDFVFSYYYRHSFETDYTAAVTPYDGAVVEYSVNGASWTNVSTLTAQVPTVAPTYTATISAGGGNVLEGQPAYARASTGFPGFRQQVLNFKDYFRKQGITRVQLRFHVASDSGQGAYGMDLAEPSFSGASLVFPSRVEQPAAAGACNQRPVASVGNPQVVAEFVTVGGQLQRNTVTLNGTGSFDPDAASGDALSYQWTQVGGQAVATLNNANTATPTFVTDVAATQYLRFQLVVTDAQGKASQPKTVDIGVNNVNRAPVVVATAPETVNEGDATPVVLNASGSTDADGETLTFTWAQTAGTPTVTLTNANTAQASFVAPQVTEDTQLTFTVTVTDGLAKSTKSVAVTVKNVNGAPVVDAGADQEAEARTTVTLAGTATDPDGDALTYAWTQVDGTNVTLTGGNTASATFTAPDVSADTVLSFRLTATANGVSVSDLVNVTVHKANRAPTGTGGTITVDEGAKVTLNSNASDPDGDTLTYEWTQTGGPSVSLTGANSPKLEFTAPQVKSDTDLTFSLTVTDSDGATTGAINYTVKVKNKGGGCSSTGGSVGGMAPLMALLAAMGLSRRRKKA